MAAAAPSVSVTCSAPSGRIRSGSDVDPGDPLCKWLTAQLRMSNLLPGRMPECSKLCGHLFVFIIHVCPASTFIDLPKATNRLITSIPANDCNTTRMTVRGSADHSVALRARPARQARDQRGEYRVRRWPVGSHPWMAADWPRVAESSLSAARPPRQREEDEPGIRLRVPTNRWGESALRGRASLPARTRQLTR